MWTHFEMEVLSPFYLIKAILSSKTGTNWSRLLNRAISTIKCWLSHISKGWVQMQLYRKNRLPKSWSKMGKTLLWFEPELNDRRNRVWISLRLPNNLFEKKLRWANFRFDNDLPPISWALATIVAHKLYDCHPLVDCRTLNHFALTWHRPHFFRCLVIIKWLFMCYSSGKNPTASLGSLKCLHLLRTDATTFEDVSNNVFWDIKTIFSPQK